MHRALIAFIFLISCSTNNFQKIRVDETPPSRLPTAELFNLKDLLYAKEKYRDLNFAFNSELGIQATIHAEKSIHNQNKWVSILNLKNRTQLINKIIIGDEFSDNSQEQYQITFSPRGTFLLVDSYNHYWIYNTQLNRISQYSKEQTSTSISLLWTSDNSILSVEQKNGIFTFTERSVLTGKNIFTFNIESLSQIEQIQKDIQEKNTYYILGKTDTSTLRQLFQFKRVDGAGILTKIPLPEAYVWRHLGQNKNYLSLTIGYSQNNYLDTNIIILDKSSFRVLKEFKGYNLKFYSDSQGVFTKTQESTQPPFLVDTRNGEIKKLQHRIQMPCTFEVSNSELSNLYITAKTAFFKNYYLSINGETLIVEDMISPIKNQEFLNVKSLTFINQNKQKLLSYFYQNKTMPSKGHIIFLHGGYINSGTLDFTTQMGREIYTLTQAGYSILSLSYSGDFTENGTTQTPFFGTFEVKDVMNAYQFLLKTSPQKPIYLWGHSHGATLANFIASYYTEDFYWSGIISHAGVWGYDNTAEKMTADENHSYFNKYYKDKSSTFIKLQQPINFAKSIRSPILVIHGLNDKSNSPMKTLNDFLTLGDKNNLDVTKLILQKSGHTIDTNTDDFEKYFTTLFAFLKKTEGRLPPVNDTNSLQQTQFTKKMEDLISQLSQSEK